MRSCEPGKKSHVRRKFFHAARLRLRLEYVVEDLEDICSEPDYIMSLKSPQQVRDIAAALPDITETEFRRRYFAIEPESYGCPVNEADFAYTWD